MNLERFRQYLTREVALRLLASAALALILWALVTMRADPETNRTYNEVKVEALNLDDSLVVVNELAPVRVRLSGPESDVQPITAENLLATVDASSIAQPGIYELAVSVKPPSGVWRISVEPSTTSVVVERSEQATFPLVPAITDLDDNSLRTVTVESDVDTVTVTGPASAIAAIDRVVIPIEIAGGTQTFQDVFIPQAVDRSSTPVPGVTIEPSVVTATVRVSARGKTVAVLANIVGSPAPGYEVAARTVNPQFVVVDGNEAALDALVALSTEPIDVTGEDASFTRTVAITGLPDGVRILEPVSGTVEVLVQITQRGVRQSLPSQQVTIVGVGPGLSASVSPDEITIEVVAPEDALAALDATSLQVIVDATGLAAGTYTVQPSVIMPPRVQWVTSLPTELTLTLVATEPSPVTDSTATGDT